MPNPANQNQPPAPKPWQPRFGIGAMLLVMLVFCVLAAGANYLVQGLRAKDAAIANRSPQLIFLLFTLAGPMLLMVVVSIVRVFLRPRRTRRRK